MVFTASSFDGGDTKQLMQFYRLLLAFLFCAGAAFAPAAVAQHEHGSPDAAILGSVNFPTSCTSTVQPDFNRAVALLHSFWYKKSEETFQAVAKADPSCGMAEWGVAMSHYRQLWDPPTQLDLQAGEAAVRKAKATSPKTQRERDYIAAMELFYKDSDTRSHTVRALDYEKSMQQIYGRYPEDIEAAIFYALAVRADAPISDKTYANQKRASAILEKLFAEYPDHPGLAHYIIHCDDYPALAPLALDAARRYAKIAPDAPHALHMPSHIFTRLGLWQESIDSNIASAAAARKNGLAGDELHAMDYLAYAYLQTGEDLQALNVLASLPKVARGDPAYFTALYATAAIPSRLAVERHRWSDAAALALPPDTFPGGRYAWTECDLYFARALGLARGGKTDGARDAVQQMASLRDTLLAEQNNYSAEQVDIQREIVTAWISFAEGKKDDALRQMRSAADHEDSTEKLPVTPGAIVPARELLGEMFLEAKQSASALEAFEASLKLTPERFNSLYGAARAAQLAGDRRNASAYYSKLLANCPRPTADLPELREAKLFLTQK
jgi:tetratricopeptide (TPR) repeat protein